jgi:nitric oxide dioxygenase
MPLSQKQVALIKATVPVLKEHGNAITTCFYDTLLAEELSLNEVFNQANQANGRQASALAGALYAYASHIDNLGALTPAVEKICHKHASLYIKPEQYDVVGRYLLRAMGDVLGSALTDDILDAWSAAYQQLAELMISREAELLEGAQGWDTWRKFTVARKVRESDEITSFYFEPVDKEPLPSYHPGQYVSVAAHVPELGYTQSRQYSLSSAPSTKFYRISVKKEQGAKPGRRSAASQSGYISNVLHEQTRTGDVIKLSHPFGEFFWDLKQDLGKPVVFISAGVGITPFVSMLDTITTQKAQQQIVFLHSARTSAVRAFKEHIESVVAAHPNVRYKNFLTLPGASEIQGEHFHEHGRLAIEALDEDQDLLLNNRDALYFICGPETFMLDNSVALERFGVPSSRIRLEVFGAGAIPAE